jgi:predicted PhzF superfamily epimerase YddE/YHI9
VLNALGISSPSLHVDCPLQTLTKGGTRLLIGLKSADLLDSIKPDFEELARLTSHVGAEGYFVFALTGEGWRHRHAVAHVRAGARHSGRSGQRQRARHARRVSGDRMA